MTKYKLHENVLLDSYIGITYTDDIAEYNKIFETEQSLENLGAFFHRLWIPGHKKNNPEEKRYYVCLMLVFEANRPITHGTITHEIAHAAINYVNFICQNNKMETGTFGDEMHSMLVEYFTDFAFKFFKENNIEIVYVDELDWEPKEEIEITN